MEVRKGRVKRIAEVQSMLAVSTTFAPTRWIRMLPCNATVSEGRASDPDKAWWTAARTGIIVTR